MVQLPDAGSLRGRRPLHRRHLPAGAHCAPERPDDRAGLTAAPALRGRIAPDQAWPAGQPGLAARTIVLPDALPVRVVEAGPPDGPPVVLVHGWACSAFEWRHVIPALCDAGFRVVAPDLKGHGFSGKPSAPEEYSAPAMTAHLLAILDALGLDRTALVGHSMGGAIVAAAALAAPGRVTHLGLVAPVGFGTVYGLGVVRVASPRYAVPMLPHLVPRWLVAAVFRLTFGTPPARFPVADLEQYWAPTQFAEYVPALRHLLHTFDWTPHGVERLRRLDVPVRVLFGTRDRVVVPRQAAALVRELPTGALEIVEGAGHMLPEEAPARVTHALLELLAG